MQKTYGSDPELALFKDGKPQSAIGVVNGTSDDRISVHGHEFYYDNVLAECAIKPGKTKKEVLKNFRECFQIYANLVKPYKLVPQASEIFPDDQLTHPDARKVNCHRDFCPYEMKQKDGPIDAIQNGNLRSCGGHIHLGADVLRQDGPEPILAVFMLDLFCGVTSIWLDKDPTSLRRRAIYGQAGRYRTKPYGLEYRSLSNFWLESPEMTGLIYDLSNFAVDFVETRLAWDFWSFDIEKYPTPAAWECRGYNHKNVAKGINTSNKELLAESFDLVLNLLPTKLKKDLEKMTDRDNQVDFYKSWDIR